MWPPQRHRFAFQVQPRPPELRVPLVHEGWEGGGAQAEYVLRKRPSPYWCKERAFFCMCEASRALTILAAPHSGGEGRMLNFETMGGKMGNTMVIGT